METFGAILLQIIQLARRLLRLARTAKHQDEQEALEKHPGRFLHDHFSSSVHEDEPSGETTSSSDKKSV
jgi:hypothetical protein